MFEYVFAVAGLCSPTPDMSVMTTRHAHCTRVRRQTASRASGAHKKVTALSAPVCETLPVLAVAGAVLAGAASDGASEVAGRFARRGVGRSDVVISKFENELLCCIFLLPHITSDDTSTMEHNTVALHACTTPPLRAAVTFEHATGRDTVLQL